MQPAISSQPLLSPHFRCAESPGSATKVPNLKHEIGDGVRWVYRGSGLATLAIATHIWFVANAILGAVMAPYALITLGLSPLQFGIVTALVGVGGLLGAGVSSAGGRRLGTGGAVIAAHVVTTLGVGAMVLAGSGGPAGGPPRQSWARVRPASGSASASATPTR